MNCGVCYKYLREKNSCPGCRFPDEDKPPTKWTCKILTCEVMQEKQYKYCYLCADFPCKVIKHLDKRYGTKYNTSVVDNLNFIKEQGIRAFIWKEKEKWSCSECEGVVSMHTGSCSGCGKQQFHLI